jgi:hypothetical protein
MVDRDTLIRLVRSSDWGAIQDLLEYEEAACVEQIRRGDIPHTAADKIRSIHMVREMIALRFRQPDGTLAVNPFPKEILC